MGSLIGTAGHVDHGKTSLLKALTGIETDRLPEEARRGMSIEIGFAVIDLPGHAGVSIVDVPGHERFLANMLVGALGTDVALLCVAADEGVMPQTREHLAILGLLPVQRLVVALTKADLADETMTGLAQADIEEALAGTRFAGSPVVPVSAATGAGLEALRRALAAALDSAERQEDGAWYLPIDRVFTVAGHGTVVTGTMMRGRVERGATAEVVPGGLRVRVRSVQGHGAEVDSASQGQRAGLNLAGVKPGQVERGQAVGEPGALVETRVADAEVTWLAQPAHARRVRVSIGADEAIARAYLSNSSPSLVQLRFERPVAAARGQPLIVRDYSPPTLLGGGRVTVPAARVRRKGAAVPSGATGTASEALASALASASSGMTLEEAAAASGLPPREAKAMLGELAGKGGAVELGDVWLAGEYWDSAQARLLAALEALHAEFATRASFPAHVVAKRAGIAWPGKIAEAAMARLSAAGGVRSERGQFSLEGLGPRLSERQRSLLDRVSAHLDSAGAGVPSPEEAAAELGLPRQAVEEIVRVGLEAGVLVRVGDGLVYTRAGLAEIARRAREALGEGAFAASQFRDALGTTRRFAIPLLEHFDSTGVTLRQGDHRVFR